MNARDKILNRIRSIEAEGRPNEFSQVLPEKMMVEPEEGQDLVAYFIKELKKVGGFAEEIHSQNELYEKLDAVVQDNNIQKIWIPGDECLEGWQTCKKLATEELNQVDAVLTGGELAIAQTGTVVSSTEIPGGKKAFAAAPIHIILINKEQIRNTISEGLLLLQKKYGNELPGQITFITGSSRTADIEKTLVMGAHGPVKLIVFILKLS